MCEDSCERMETDMATNAKDYSDFLNILLEEEQKTCYQNFIQATCANALLQEVCVVCARVQWAYEGVCWRT